MSRVLLALLASLLFVVAGCSDKGGDSSSSTNNTDLSTGTDGKTTTHDSTSHTGTSSSGAAGVNHAPTGGMQVSLTTGKLPVIANFTLTGTDPEGDKITWTLDADHDGKTDRDGSTLPITVGFTYTKAGVYNATFTLSDGKLKNVVWRNVNVTAVTGPAGPVTWWAHRDTCGSTVAANDGGRIDTKNTTDEGADLCGAFGCGGGEAAGPATGKPLPEVGSGCEANGDLADFPATETSGAWPSGTKVNGVVHMAYFGAGVSIVTVHILADGKEVAKYASEPKQVTGDPTCLSLGLPGEPVPCALPVPETYAFPFSITTSADVAAGATLQLNLEEQGTTGGAFPGIDGDHATHFALG